ncbi:MAG TPA: hypothetical protein VIK53_16965 [Verrucomicrobiae bacterium]
MKLTALFIKSAGVILLAAALMRFLIAAGNAQIMALPEPMLGMPIRYAVLLVGGFELVVAFICLFGRSLKLQLGWLAWLATNYLVYWIGSFMMHIHPQTTGIGALTDPLHLARGPLGLIAMFIPVYLLLGSYTAVLWLWFGDRTLQRVRREKAETIKMACPACGAHIRFDNMRAGQTIPCPQCQAAITLHKPDLLKMSCFFCHEHIEFPPHSIGEKIPCPHCNRGITLKEPA